jgi:hypothetical protein
MNTKENTKIAAKPAADEITTKTQSISPPVLSAFRHAKNVTPTRMMAIS